MIMKIFEWTIIKGFENLVHVLSECNSPEDLSTSGTVLGTVAHPYHPERSEKAIIDVGSRLRHLYLLGGTGGGKTKLIESMIRLDVVNQNGFASIDPHGDLTRSLLCFLAKKFQTSEMDTLGQRLILVEPFNPDWAIGFNPLQAIDGHFPAMLELLEIFKKFWGNTYWGPRMDELLRNVLCTLSVNNLTLLEARPLLTDERFRLRLIENVSFREVKDY